MAEEEGFWVWVIGIFFLATLYWALWVYGHPLIAVVALVLTLVVYFKFFYQPEVAYKREAIPQWVKDEVLRRQNGTCKYDNKSYPLQFHHIIPVAKGGRSDDPNNIEALCSDHHDSISRVK